MRARPINVVLEPYRERLSIAVRGDIDLSTAAIVGQAVDSAVRDGWAHIVLDLRDVEFMDSAGLHLLEGLRRRDWSTRIELVTRGPAVEEVLALAGLTDVLPRVGAVGPSPSRLVDVPLGASDFVERMLAERARAQRAAFSPGTAS